jgi:hypothetical protein
MTEAIDIVRIADSDPEARESLFRRFEVEDYRFPKRAFLLWDGCARQRTHYSWPVGFKQKWTAYPHRGLGRLVKSRGNGPPRTAFTVADGDYIKGWELAHLYAGSALRNHNLDEKKHFTQSANLICMPRSLHLYIDGVSGVHHLWLLRGLSYLNFRYDPLGAFSGVQPNRFGFVDGLTCDVLWP